MKIILTCSRRPFHSLEIISSFQKERLPDAVGGLIVDCFHLSLLDYFLCLTLFCTMGFWIGRIVLGISSFPHTNTTQKGMYCKKKLCISKYHKAFWQYAPAFQLIKVLSMSSRRHCRWSHFLWAWSPTLESQTRPQIEQGNSDARWVSNARWCRWIRLSVHLSWLVWCIWETVVALVICQVGLLSARISSCVLLMLARFS